MNVRMRRFSENVFIQQVLNPIANPTDGSFPASGSFIDVTEFERVAFLVQVGATDDTAITAKIQAATAVNGSLSDVSGAAITGTSLAGTNDNKWAMIELETRKLLTLGADYRYITLTVAATGGTASAMSATFFGWRTRKLPPTFGSDKAEIVIVDG